jgi:hypothetical protein
MFDFIPLTDLTTETATSYLTVEEMQLIADNNYFVNFPNCSIDPDIEKILINATDILNMLFSYSGDKLVATQSLEFPRSYQTTVPNNILKATAYIAAQIKLGTVDTVMKTNYQAQVALVKADVLEKSYFENKQVIFEVFNTHPYLKQTLSSYIGSMSIKVSRG